MPRKYLVISIVKGIAKVKHKCWFCTKKHTLEYPVDDIGMDSKTNALCQDCEAGLRNFKKNNPEMC